MNSEIIAQNYANSPEMKYGGHYVTLASDKISYENPTGKFVMTYATPNASTEAFDKTLPKNNTSNVINKDNLGVNQITSSNYITLTVPKHYFYITKLEIVTNRKNHMCSHCGFDATYTCDPKIIITRKEYYKGQQFVVINAGGHIDTPCIIGVV